MPTDAGMTPADSLRAISVLLQSGDFATAQVRLQALVAANPELVEGLRLLAGTKQTLGDVPAAESLLRRALAIDPQWPPTLVSLAELLFATGRNPEALPLLQQAVRSSPRAALLLARHFLDLGQAQSALEACSPWCDAGKADVELSAVHVSALVASGQTQSAVDYYRRRLESTPEDVIAVHALAVALNALEQPGEALVHARQSVGQRPKSAAFHYTLARSLIGLQRFEEAEQALQACVRLEPRRAEAHDRLAQLVWMRSGDIEASTQALDQALERHAQDDALWATKAALLQEAGNPQAALACLRERLARPGSHPNLLLRAGLAALEFDAAAALGFAERALESQPGDATASKLLCAACLGVGAVDRALAQTSSLLDIVPDDQYVIAMHCTALRLLGDPRYQSLCDYEQMVMSMPLQPPAGWRDLDGFLRDVATQLGALHNPRGHRLLYQSLRHGTETTQDLSRSPDPVLQALFRSFEAPIEHYRARIGAGTGPLRRRNHGGFRYNGAWSVRLHSGGFHLSHVHPRGWISSACYVQLPDNLAAGTDAGDLSFGAPGLLTVPSLGADYSVRPRPGLLVLFPSYFWHGTVPFQSETPRLTVAFDAVPKKSPPTLA